MMSLLQDSNRLALQTLIYHVVATKVLGPRINLDMRYSIVITKAAAGHKTILFVKYAILYFKIKIVMLCTIINI